MSSLALVSNGLAYFVFLPFATKTNNLVVIYQAMIFRRLLYKTFILHLVTLFHYIKEREKEGGRERGRKRE